MFESIKKLFEKHYENLSGLDFKEKYKATSNAILIDVRTPSEFSQGAITGARNINFMSPSFIKTVKTLDKDKSYFLYCRSGARSGSACNEMGKLGFKVYNLSGGINAWIGSK